MTAALLALALLAQAPAPVKANPAASERDQIAKEARAATIAARGRSANIQLRTRRAWLERETNQALAKIGDKYNLTGPEVQRILDEAEEAKLTPGQRAKAAKEQAKRDRAAAQAEAFRAAAEAREKALADSIDHVADSRTGGDYIRAIYYKDGSNELYVNGRLTNRTEPVFRPQN